MHAQCKGLELHGVKTYAYMLILSFCVGRVGKDGAERGAATEDDLGCAQGQGWQGLAGNPHLLAVCPQAASHLPPAVSCVPGCSWR